MWVKIEAAVRAGFVSKTWTDLACSWNDDFKENVIPVSLAEIKLYNESAIDKFQKSLEKRTDCPFPGTKLPPRKEEINSF